MPDSGFTYGHCTGKKKLNVAVVIRGNQMGKK
jgi:hypothetical protein